MLQQDKRCQGPEQLEGKPMDCSPEQIRKCHGDERAHACLSEQEDSILAEVRESLGFVPGPLLAMSKKPGVLSNFLAYRKQFFEGGPLTDRECFLVALSAATALKSPNCIQTQSRRAQNAGATAEEVLQTILIAGLIANTSSLHVAYESAGIFSDSEAQE
jgi:alkylhydroperoxidase/carboxymuconolactone decarboxylase family protein YurZ